MCSRWGTARCAARWMRCCRPERASRLRRAALPQQLQLSHCRIAPRGTGGPRGRAWLRGARPHRRVLARRRGARAWRGRASTTASRRRRRDAAHVGAARVGLGCRHGARRRAARAARAARADAPRLRQPVGVDHRGAPACAQGAVPGAPVGPRRQGAERADARRPARLLRAAAAARRAVVRGDVCPCDVAQDMVPGRPLRDRRRTAAPRRRRAAARDGATGGAVQWPAARRGGRRAHARALAQAAARRARRHAPRPAGGAVRLRARAQRRGAPALARPAAGAVPARMAGAHARDCRQLQLLARRAALRIPARDRARRPHAGQPPACAYRGGRAAPLPWRAAGFGARADRARARADRATPVRALFPDRGRHRAVGARAGHPVPGARQRGQLGGVLLPGRHRGRPVAHEHAVRAFHQRRTQRTARHRCRLRAPAARGGHPVHLPQVRPPPRRTDGGGHDLPPALGAARHGQGTRPRPVGDRRCGQEPTLVD